jgi:hypothetical protein
MLVAHRELQIAISKANATNLRSKEPCIIIGLGADGCSATLEQMQIKKMKPHFTNILSINLNPANNIYENMDTIQSLFPDKDTRSKLSEKVRERNLEQENRHAARPKFKQN